MLDIKFIRDNLSEVKKAIENKNARVDIDRLMLLDEKKKKMTLEIEGLRSRQNAMSKAARGDKKAFGELKKLKEKMKELEAEFAPIEKEYHELMLQVPNIPDKDVPVGKDESGNKVIEQVGKPVKFDFTPKDYMEIGKSLDLIDTERAAKVAGSRFGYIKNQLVLLEFALINFGLDTVRKEGFIPVLPPVMLKDQMARGTGYFEATDEKEAYFLAEDKMYLAGTAEQPMIAMHADEILDWKKLPLRYVAFSTCFRREAGSYGKDTKGIFRVHQFDKLEMVVFSKPEDSKREHQLLLSIEEKLMKGLELPYQVVNICTGDLGMPAAAKYDIEAWLPSEKRYRETHSNSNCTDFQARRLMIRYRDKSGKVDFVHTLNGTVFSMRLLIMILENYQQKDGSVKVPKALVNYCGFSEIKLKK